MGNQVSNQRPQSGLIRVPVDYPNYPMPGKIETLFQTNAKNIYHRYSPYTDYDMGFAGKFLDFGSKQPFLWVYPQENDGLGGTRKWESRLLPIGSASRDVIRVTKFLTSGLGVIWLGKQFLLQAGNAFNETRIYNPTSPIVAAGGAIVPGFIRPQRNFDTSGGLMGIARTLIGDRIPNMFGGDATVGIPNGTAGKGALPVIHQRTDGKGLIRGETSDRGWSQFTKIWAPTTNKFSWTGLAKSIIRSVIPSAWAPAQPDGTIYRGDEGAYGIMLSAGDSRFVSWGATRYMGFSQKWIAGGKGIRKSGQKNASAVRIYNLPGEKLAGITPATKTIVPGGASTYIDGVGNTGVEIQESKIENKPGIRYGDAVGATISEAFEASEVMLDYAGYVQPGFEYTTKKTKKKDIEKTNSSLRSVVDALKKSDVYQIETTSDSPLLPSGESTDPYASGYNRLFKIKNGQPGISPLNYPGGLLNVYRDKNIRMVDNSLTSDASNQSLKLPGAGKFDALNTLTIIPGDKSDNPMSIRNSKIPGWTKWDPYRDDQIAFFFYDVVNDKYLPFRCTVKNISEASTALWEEMNFIGRADRLYSYGGFTRQLTFGFDIIISSVIELAPTWKRINYLMSLVKPARYTKSKALTINGQEAPFNKFMVPPMVMITIGDLYKKQPVVLNSINMNIPDDAIWETLNEYNTSRKEWSYLADYIKSNQVSNNKLFGQFPREARISVNCTLLEKQRAIVGSANFGHAPHTDDYHPMDIADQPYMHQALVEYQFDHTTILPVDVNNVVSNS